MTEKRVPGPLWRVVLLTWLRHRGERHALKISLLPTRFSCGVENSEESVFLALDLVLVPFHSQDTRERKILHVADRKNPR